MIESSFNLLGIFSSPGARGQWWKVFQPGKLRYNLVSLTILGIQQFCWVVNIASSWWIPLVFSFSLCWWVQLFQMQSSSFVWRCWKFRRSQSTWYGLSSILSSQFRLTTAIYVLSLYIMLCRAAPIMLAAVVSVTYIMRLPQAKQFQVNLIIFRVIMIWVNVTWDGLAMRYSFSTLNTRWCDLRLSLLRVRLWHLKSWIFTGL